MSFHSSAPHFLQLPVDARRKIYAYLLAPHPEESVVTINYSLEWPFLEHPSSTTFTAHQVDRCRCPQQRSRNANIATEDHIYTRYACIGPQVRFAPKGSELWVLEKPGPAFNVLRPAAYEERRKRAHTGIIRASKFIYQEAISYMYQERNFLLLSGICSRGRYQAYATQAWLSRLSSFARLQITHLSLICQSNEEDCRNSDVQRAYTSLARFILHHLPNFRIMCLNLWSPEIPFHPFSLLFQRQGLKIAVKYDSSDGKVYEFRDAQSYLAQEVPQTVRNEDTLDAGAAEAVEAVEGQSESGSSEGESIEILEAHIEEPESPEDYVLL